MAQCQRIPDGRFLLADVGICGAGSSALLVLKATFGKIFHAVSSVCVGGGVCVCGRERERDRVW